MPPHRICSWKPHISLPIGSNGKPLAAIDKYPNATVKLVIGKTLASDGRKLPML